MSNAQMIEGNWYKVTELTTASYYICKFKAVERGGNLLAFVDAYKYTNDDVLQWKYSLLGIPDWSRNHTVQEVPARFLQSPMPNWESSGVLFIDLALEQIAT